MENNNYEEHPLESWLDADSEEEFGEPDIRDRFDPGADESSSGNLKEWSAQDFASIYVRFRPHLERHARRYLSNPVQAEEVVQDAFLYLMTSLPELDSELGVLKFLKWKIRLLSLDVIRASSSRREVSVPEHAEYASEDQEIFADLERAEDSAVIRMALAKLSPRHREALIASVYEEKSSEVVAEQMGLSQNATRQLLFRARSAFKKALVGEAEIQGRSVSQVLSIAAKKAASDARDNAVRIGAFIVLVAVGVGVVPSLVPSSESVVAESAPIEIQPLQTQSSEETTPSGTASLDAPSNAISVAPEQNTPPENDSNEELAPSDSAEGQVISEPAPDSVDPDPRAVSSVEQRLTNQSLGTILTTDVSNAGFYTDSYAVQFGDLFRGVSVEVFGGTGVSAFLDLNIESKSVDQIIFQMWIDGERYYGAAKSFESKTVDSGNVSTITVNAEEIYVVDEQGNVFSDSPLSNSEAVIKLQLSSDGSPERASLRVVSQN